MRGVDSRQQCCQENQQDDSKLEDESTNNLSMKKYNAIQQFNDPSTAEYSTWLDK